MKSKFLLQFLLLSLVLLATPLAAETIVVTSVADDGPGSLRAAVTEAAAGDDIVFSSAIDFSTIFLTSGMIVIDKDLTINGNGLVNSQINAGGNSRIFMISGATVQLANLVLRNGATDGNGGAIMANNANLTLDRVAIFRSEARGAEVGMGGGAIANMGGGTLSLLNGTRLSDNHANGASGSGGGLFNGPEGMVTLDNVLFDRNTASRAGGGFEDASGGTTTVMVTDVVFRDNETGSAPGNGGAIHISGDGNMMIVGGEAEDNVAAREGGGFWNGSGTMTITGTLISDNDANGTTADDGGGGLFNNGGTLNVMENTRLLRNRAIQGSGSGGGIFNAEGGTLNVLEANISGNRASRAGGGIEDASGEMTLVTIRETDFLRNVTGASPGNGGAIHITGPGDMNVTGGTTMWNRAAREGGGFWNGSGTMRVDSVLFRGNRATGDAADDGGGALFNNGGVLMVRNSDIEDNRATGDSGSGGGIFNADGGTLMVMSSELISNQSSRAGGGIEDASGAGTMVTVTNTNFGNNFTGSAPGNGGAIHITGAGDSEITGGDVTGNFAFREGGGFWNGSGTMTVTMVSFTGNTGAGPESNRGGGGLFNNGGILNVLDSQFDGNQATGMAGSGGAILNNAGGVLNVSGSNFSENTSRRAGGAIEDVSGAETTATITDSDFSGNRTGSSPGNGGAIHITGPSNMDIVGGLVSGNYAAREGGGFWNGSGIMTVDNVIFENNLAAGAAADDGGGALFNNGGDLTVMNSEISDNRATGASGSGGGILNVTDGELAVMNTSFVNNGSSRAGGGIEDASGDGTTITVTNSDFTGNYTGAAPGNGGAIHITGAGDSEISGGSATNNRAAKEGGAFWNGSGTMDVSGVNFCGNEAPAGNDLFNAGGTINTMNNDNCDDNDSSSRIAGDLPLIANGNATPGLRIYPNPTSGSLTTLRLPSTEMTRVTVTDINGRAVQSATVTNGSLQLQLEGQPAGTYLVRISSATLNETNKLVLRR